LRRGSQQGHSPTLRKLLVCVQKHCHHFSVTCLPTSSVVPDGCPFAILHLLETREGGSQIRDRQTGKTTELMGIAKDFADAGYKVYYIAENSNMAWHIESRFGRYPNVMMMGVGQVDHYLRGMAPGIILADELTMQQMQKVRAVAVGHTIVAHYWTPRP